MTLLFVLLIVYSGAGYVIGRCLREDSPTWRKVLAVVVIAALAFTTCAIIEHVASETIQQFNIRMHAHGR